LGIHRLMYEPWPLLREETKTKVKPSTRRVKDITKAGVLRGKRTPEEQERMEAQFSVKM